MALKERDLSDLSAEGVELTEALQSDIAGGQFPFLKTMGTPELRFITAELLSQWLQRSPKGKLLARSVLSAGDYPFPGYLSWTVQPSVTEVETIDLVGGHLIGRLGAVYADGLLTLPPLRVSENQLGWLIEITKGTEIVWTHLNLFGHDFEGGLESSDNAFGGYFGFYPSGYYYDSNDVEIDKPALSFSVSDQDISVDTLVLTEEYVVNLYVLNSGGGGSGSGLSQSEVTALIAVWARSGEDKPKGVGSYYDYADRTIVVESDRDSAPEVALTVHTGTMYDLVIENNSDLVHLLDIVEGTDFRVSQGNSLWTGRVESYSKAGDVWTFRIDFTIRRSTFTIGESVHIEFGAVPDERASFFYGNNQTERVPPDLSSIHEVEAGGIKSWTGNANENIHGGIAHTFLNSNDIADADHKVDVENTAIQIDESGHFHFRIKGFGNQTADANTRVRLYKVMSGIDDVTLFSIAPYFVREMMSMPVDLDTVTEFFDEEQYINVSSGDQFIVVLSEYGSAFSIFACYLEIARVD